MKKKFLAAVMACVLALAFVPFASAVEPLTTAKTATPTSDPMTFDITLSLPGEEEITTTDVVFVMDKSSASQQGGAVTIAAQNMITSLSTLENANINVGVILFNSQATAATPGLLDISDAANLTTVTNALSMTNTQGTNMPAALDIAKQWLDADTTVAAANKHVILLSDFGSYIYSDGEGNAYMHRGVGAGDYAWNTESAWGKYQAGGTNLLGYTVSDFNALVMNGRLFDGTQVGDMAWLSDIDPAQGDCAYPGDGNAAFVPFLYAIDKPVGLEKSLYQAAHDLIDMKDAGYNVTTLSWTYNPESPNLSAVCAAAADWVEANIGTRYDLATADPDTMWSNIENDITYACYRGTIKDVMGSYFDVVTDNGTINADTFKLAVGGTPVAGTMISDTQVGYGSNGAGDYAYVLTYDPAADSYTCKINVPVEKANPLTVSYQVTVGDIANLPAGDYNEPTNESAVISYITASDSSFGLLDDSDARSATFPVPYVSFSIAEQQIEEVTPTPVPPTQTVAKTTVNKSKLAKTGDMVVPFAIALGALAAAGAVTLLARRRTDVK